jgi:hypothetical protein
MSASGGSGSNVQKVTTIGAVGAIDAKESGDWDYVAGTGGGTEVVAGRMVGSYFYANSATGTMTIDGGKTITIRANVGIAINPKGNLINPVIVMSSSIDYMIEFVV